MHCETPPDASSLSCLFSATLATTASKIKHTDIEFALSECACTAARALRHASGAALHNGTVYRLLQMHYWMCISMSRRLISGHILPPFGLRPVRLGTYGVGAPGICKTPDQWADAPSLQWVSGTSAQAFTGADRQFRNATAHDP